MSEVSLPPAFLTKSAMKDMVVPTVGLRRWERESMTGLANPPNLSLIVQTLGGELPQWVSPSDPEDEQCDAEFVIVRGLPSSRLKSNVPAPSLRKFSPKTRVILSAAAMGAAPNDRFGFPGTDLLIEAKDEDLDLVGEALAAVFAGNLLIGVDWADLLLTAGAVRPFVGIGSAILSNGIHDAASVPPLHTAVANSNGALLLVHLVSHADEGKFSLDAYDAFTTQLLAQVDNQTCLVTAALGASCTVLAQFTFKSRTMR